MLNKCERSVKTHPNEMPRYYWRIIDRFEFYSRLRRSNIFAFWGGTVGSKLLNLIADSWNIINSFISYAILSYFSPFHWSRLFMARSVSLLCPDNREHMPLSIHCEFSMLRFRWFEMNGVVWSELEIGTWKLEIRDLEQFNSSANSFAKSSGYCFPH